MISSVQMNASTTLSLIVFGVSCMFLTVATYDGGASIIGSAGTPHAGFVGTLAGHLSGGAALDALNKLDGALEHDFGDIASEVGDAGDVGAGEEEHHQAEVESLSGLGEHLSEHEFPHDFGGDAGQHGEGVEYAEAAAEATEQFEHYAHGYEAHGAAELGGGKGLEHGLGEEDDFHTKPVPGIDHGKGAFSYSTTYEFKDEPPKHDDWKLL